MKKNDRIFLWITSLVFILLLIVIMNWWVFKVSDSKIWALFIFITVPIIQFLITPLFTVLGFYTYLSPMVVVMGINKRVLDLHNGTSFDYLLKMRKTKLGREWKKKMLKYYLKALLNVIKKIENGHLRQNITVRGSSYFLSERSAKRLGFTISNTSIPEKINIVLNYLDLIWMYSLSERKIIFPNLKNIKTVSIKGHQLLENKKYIKHLNDRLDSNKE